MSHICVMSLPCDPRHRLSRLKVDMRRQPFLSHRALPCLPVFVMAANDSQLELPLQRLRFSFGGGANIGAGGVSLPRRL